jgi:hypothetical protein
MIAADNIIASSLELEPNIAAVHRDLFRADKLGAKQIVVNENMFAAAVAEAQRAGLGVQVVPAVGFPIGQWFWPMKLTAIRAFEALRAGPVLVMHSVGSWLDRTDAAETEANGIRDLKGQKWLMTSLSLIPPDRLDELADDVTSMGVEALFLSNGVAASKIPAPESELIGVIRKVAAGRFKIVARPEAGAGEAVAKSALDAGADAICSDDFWQLSE